MNLIDIQREMGEWKTQAGETAVIAACGSAYCITAKTGEYAGQQLGSVKATGNEYAGKLTDPRNKAAYSGKLTVSGDTCRCQELLDHLWILAAFGNNRMLHGQAQDLRAFSEDASRLNKAARRRRFIASNDGLLKVCKQDLYLAGIKHGNFPGTED